MLIALASANHPDALIFDLVWHDDEDKRERGMEVLRLLGVKGGYWGGVEVVIYSKIADEYRDRLNIDFGIKDDQIFDHYADKLYVVADYFE
jgi:hypothetical protein